MSSTEPNKRNEVFEYRKCIQKDCNKDFYISMAEKDYFESKGFHLPKRCYQCRVANRQNNGSTNEKSSSN